MLAQKSVTSLANDSIARLEMTKLAGKLGIKDREGKDITEAILASPEAMAKLIADINANTAGGRALL